jgi:PST family polysaccharide transporter
MGTLAPTLRRGAKISAAALAFTQMVSFLQTLALARILSPEEVGIFYSGTVLSMFLVTVAEGGLRSALIQRQHHLEEAANTVFWASLAAGGLWALLSLAAAPVVAVVFDSSTAGLVAAVSAGSLVLQGLTYVPDSLLQRRFDFRQRMYVQPSVTVTFAVGSITLCSHGMGVWGLVVASYLSMVVWVVISWALAGWRPRRGLASLAVWRQLARYGMPLVLGAAADRGKDVLDTVLVGGFLGAPAVGNYRYGRRLGMLPGTVIIEIGSYVLFPAFARTASHPARFKSAFLRSLRALWLVAMPSAGMIVALGHPAIVLLLGEPWSDAAVMFAALAGSGPGVALAAVGFEAIKGHGRTTLLNWVNGTGLVVGVGALLALLQFGLFGVGLALSITSVFAGLLSVLLARRLVGVSLRELAARLLSPLVAALIATVSWGLLDHLVIHTDQRGIAVGLLMLMGEGIGYVVTYGAVLLLISPSAVSELRDAAFQQG